MGDMTLTVFDTDDARRLATLRLLADHLTEYHRWNTGGEWRQLFVSLCDPTGEVLGGLLSHTHGSWLEVEFVWVAEPLRRRGHATQLLAAAETEAKTRRCRRACLDTATSQTADFFLQRGYRICGELPDYRDGRSRYWLHKTLCE
ncbi:GNAT family N-acetyltransferase [Zavarzinella formosa]|uniref:GNAT family N-acetyltransferase n=1 Tax=Zavarzinella formosa TaxID=360055 RepID=UPI0002E70715|nr:GNAT family N-acetyltransferase [Zavarzinella formosa]